MDSVPDLIRALGGYSKVAAHLGVTPHAVAKFRKRGIPAKHWMSLSRIAGITFDRLESISKAATAGKPRRRSA